jgi:hypothetical protein
MSDPSGAVDGPKLAVLNLHDAFMNANLLQNLMERTPPSEICPGREREDWTISPRGRLERLWMSMLYVLLEAWEQNHTARHAVTSVVDAAALQELIERCRAEGILDALRETRHYMCHRDKRQYWDDGRLAIVGHLALCTVLMKEFGAVLLAAIRARRTAPAE